MNNTMMQTTTQIPSGFAVPTCGHAFDVISGRVALSGASLLTEATAVVGRDRQGVVYGAKATFPGSLAWRPPTS